MFNDNHKKDKRITVFRIKNYFGINKHETRNIYVIDMSGEGIGFGKAILFNEHFVVYGLPAIVSAIAKYTRAKVEPTKKSGWILIDNRNATLRYKEDKIDQQKDSVNLMIKKMGLDLSKNGVEITLEGNLYVASGIGASAASCVAITRALSKHFQIDFSNDEINEIAYEGEKGYHGTPSGIDNTASTFGGLIWFEKGEENVMDKITLQSPVEIVIGNTGKVANTTAAVAGVKERRGKFPQKYAEIFDRAENIAYLARDALQDEDLKELGKLMNENHKLLQQIEVSSRELDFLVKLARDQGAYGAKLTGGGLGGNMIALTPNKDIQERVANAFEKEGFQSLRTSIGVTLGEE